MEPNIRRRWLRHAEEKAGEDAVIHRDKRGQHYRWTFSALMEKAMVYADYLRASGIRRGEVCALIIRHHPEFYPLYLGISFCGALPSVLAYPNSRIHPEKFREGLIGMSQRSGLDHLLTEKDLLPVIGPLIGRNEHTIRSVLLPFEELSATAGHHEQEVCDIPDTEPLLLQHSSGTTGLQKPVMLSHRAVMGHAETYGRSIDLHQGDKVVSWLPLYHDMGLMAAFHVPLYFGVPSVQIDPFAWVIAPEMLLEAISDEQATLCWMPNFAFKLMADRIRIEDIEEPDLKSIRMWICAGEPVRKNSLDAFVKKFSAFGLQEGCISTLYGMAETTMGVTQTPAGETPAVIRVDKAALSEGRLVLTDDPEAGRELVSSGRLLEGCSVRILSKDLEDQPASCVGEIAIRSPYLFDAYRNYPEKTAEVMRHGWYLSGDLGFEHEGWYYVIGRKKDLIISAGKNIYPEDAEESLGSVSGLTPGRMIVFGEESEALGTEVISLIAETEISGEEERRSLRMAILQKAMELDLTISAIYLVPSRWLIKSSAGKPGRDINKKRILDPAENQKWRIL